MATFDHLPREFNSNRPNALWVPRNSPTPPKYFTVNSHYDMKDAVNLFYRYSSFACGIDNINKNKKSRKDQSGIVTSFTLRCACGRDYKKTSTRKRP